MIGIHPADLEKSIADITAIKDAMREFFRSVAVTDYRECEIYDISIYRESSGTYKITITLRFPGIFLGIGGAQARMLMRHIYEKTNTECTFVLNEHDIWK